MLIKSPLTKLIEAVGCGIQVTLFKGMDQPNGIVQLNVIFKDLDTATRVQDEVLKELQAGRLELIIAAPPRAAGD